MRGEQVAVVQRENLVERCGIDVDGLPGGVVKDGAGVVMHAADVESCAVEGVVDGPEGSGEGVGDAVEAVALDF